MSVIKQIGHTLDGQEPVWVLLLTDAFHEDGQVVMVVELLNLDFPRNLVREAMLNLDGQIATVVEATELTARNDSFFISSGSWGKNFRLLLGPIERADFAATSLAFLSVIYRSTI